MHSDVAAGPDSPIAAGTWLGKYQVVRLIGEGGMGAVYEGVHVGIGKKVAIKVLSPDLAGDPDARARFLREAQLTSRVRHPHAVDVTDVGSEAGRAFLVMELLDGEDLASFIEWRGRMPLEQAADIMLPVLAAVAAAHDEGIVHRDLKPHNIFLAQTRDGTIVPKVVDFGISKGPPEQEPAATPPPAIVPVVKTTVGLLGSPAYLSPEQIEGPRTVSAASDQYALGVILYECVTGRRWFGPDDGVTKIFSDILNGNRPLAGQLRPDLPEAFQRVIDRATSRDPAARYPSVRAMGKELLAFASPKGALTWASTFADASAWGAPPVATASRRTRALCLVAAAAALAAAAGIAWGTWRVPTPRTIDAPAPLIKTQTRAQWIVIPAETPRPRAGQLSPLHAATRVWRRTDPSEASPPRPTWR